MSHVKSDLRFIVSTALYIVPTVPSTWRRKPVIVQRNVLQSLLLFPLKFLGCNLQVRRSSNVSISLEVK